MPDRFIEAIEEEMCDLAADQQAGARHNPEAWARLNDLLYRYTELDLDAVSDRLLDDLQRDDARKAEHRNREDGERWDGQS